MLAAWVSAPFFTGNVKADGTPVILTRTAVLTPAAGSDPHGSAEWQLYQSGNRELEVEIEDVNLGQGTSPRRIYRRHRCRPDDSRRTPARPAQVKNRAWRAGSRRKRRIGRRGQERSHSFGFWCIRRRRHSESDRHGNWNSVPVTKRNIDTITVANRDIDTITVANRHIDSVAVPDRYIHPFTFADRNQHTIAFADRWARSSNGGPALGERL